MPPTCARVEGTELVQGTAELQIRIASPSPVVMPLGPCNLSLCAVRWQAATPRPAVVGQDQAGQLGCLVENNGTLSWDWTLPGAAEASGAVTFALQLPPATVSSLRLDLPADRLLSVEGGVAEAAARRQNRRAARRQNHCASGPRECDRSRRPPAADLARRSRRQSFSEAGRPTPRCRRPCPSTHHGPRAVHLYDSAIVHRPGFPAAGRCLSATLAGTHAAGRGAIANHADSQRRSNSALECRPHWRRVKGGRGRAARSRAGWKRQFRNRSHRPVVCRCTRYAAADHSAGRRFSGRASNDHCRGGVGIAGQAASRLLAVRRHAVSGGPPQ